LFFTDKKGKKKIDQEKGGKKNYHKMVVETRNVIL